MIEDICFHIVDLVQNSVTAGAGNVKVALTVSEKRDLIELIITDDGRGMGGELIRAVQDPFYTTKSGKKVGLGIPLMKATALQSEGNFAITSALGKGTEITASYRKSHLDTPPLGPVKETVFNLIVATPDVNVQFICRTDSGEFSLSTADIREQIGDLPLSHPEVIGFLRRFIESGLNEAGYGNKKA